MPSLGIDLGTTFTCAFISDEDGKLHVLELHHGSPITRSVVRIANGKWTIPRPTDQHIPQRNHHISLAKRLIGRSSADGRLEEDTQRVEYAVLDQDGPAFDVDGRVCPEEISAFILGRIRRLANTKTDTNITACVLAVPAYFTHQQREATLDAAEMAGFHRQHVRLVAEPLAALVAHISGNESAPDGHWFVIDIGGGTADVTVAYLEKTHQQHCFVVKATAGDNLLGGADFDESLRSYIYENLDLYEHDADHLRMLAACERAKEELSHTQTTTVVVEDANGDELCETTITLEEAEKAWAVQIARIRSLFQDALEQSTAREIGNVLIAGGTGNMPCIRSIIKEMLPNAQIHHSHLSEAVGRGAAYMAADHKIATTDVLPRAIGIRIRGGRMSEILHRNEALPAQATKTFYTPEDSVATLRIAVLEGDQKQARRNILLGTFLIRDLPPLPSNTPVEVDIEIDRLGEVAASARLEARSESLDIRYEPRRKSEELRRLRELTSMRLDGKSTADSKPSLKRDRSHESPGHATIIPIKRIRSYQEDLGSDAKDV